MAYNPNPALVEAIKRRTPDPDFQAVLLSTALAESGGRLDAIGDQGNSGGPYQENSAGRGHGIPMQQRFDPVASTDRAYREFTSFRTSDPGTWAARAQRPADPQGYASKVRNLLPVARRILGDGGGTVSTASPPPAGLPGGWDAASTKKIAAYLKRSEQDVLAGRQPQDVLQLVPSLNRAPAPSAQVSTPSLESGGGWGGTASPVLRLTEISGLKVTSGKRARKATASGGVSDHWEGNHNAYAHDLGWGGERPTPQADAAASRIVAALGGPADWGKTGGVFNKVIDGIRYQVIYRSDVGGNHWNHVHVGARRVG